MVEVPALMTLPGVDIMAAGQWDLSTGPTTFTPQDMADAVEAAQCPAIGDPVIKLGHNDPRFNGDGEPALGHVTNMSLAAEGNKIRGDLSGLPGWLGAVMSSAYPQRSIEGAYYVQCSIGHTHPFVITGLALLGVSAPGIGVLNSVEDVAALYGVSAARAPLAARSTWTVHATAGGEPMPAAPAAAGVTTEDVRRSYYMAAPLSYWITEMQMDPPQLIVCDDATDKVYRVPFKIAGGAVTFSDPVEVEVEYMDVAASRRTGQVLVWASAGESRRGMEVEAAWSASTQVSNMGDDPSQSAINHMFALPAGTKSDSKLPHHTADASTHAVDGPDLEGCQAAIAAINGSRGGLSGVSAADLKKAYNHLAAHVRSLGGEPADYSGPAASAADTQAAPAHGPMNGTHAHPHGAYGSQGGDATHDHSHAHAGDGSHDHAHASAGQQTGRGPEVDFTTDQEAQIRASLGLKDDDELTAELIARWVTEQAAAVSAAKGDGESKASGDGESGDGQSPEAVAASHRLPPGIVALDKEQYERMQAQLQQGVKARSRQLEDDRERALDAAVRAGKFSAARIDHWRRVWNSDPEGTAMVLAGLTPGVVPTRDIGQPGEEPDVLDTEYESLFPKSYRRQALRD
jgi:hypothetical protein